MTHISPLKDQKLYNAQQNWYFDMQDIWMIYIKVAEEMSTTRYLYYSDAESMLCNIPTPIYIKNLLGPIVVYTDVSAFAICK